LQTNKTDNMKKILFITALIAVAISAQSCCVTASCPGVAAIEAPQTNS